MSKTSTSTITAKNTVAEIRAAIEALGVKAPVGKVRKSDLMLALHAARKETKKAPAKPAAAAKEVPPLDALEVRVSRLWTRVYVDGRKVAKISNTADGRKAAERDERLPAHLRAVVLAALANVTEADETEDAA